jgi:hypothetical protein
LGAECRKTPRDYIMILSNKKFTFGSLGFLGGLTFTLVAYLYGIPSIYFYTFTVILVSLIVLNISVIEDLSRGEITTNTSAIIVLSLLVLFFLLRINISDFSLFVGDASDYLWSGVGSVTQGVDTGFFLPLSASVSGMGYQIFGLKYISFSTTLVYSSVIPTLYFLLKETKLEIYQIILGIIFFISTPLSIWFSKTTFSEPVWQALLIMLLVYATRFLETRKPSYLEILPLFALIGLTIFSRGSSVFLFGLLVFLTVYHFWRYQNNKILIIFLVSILFLDLIFFYILQIRSPYLIGWQFSRVISDITSAKLIILLLGLLFVCSVLFYAINRYKEQFSKLNFPFVIVVITIIVKITVAYYFSTKSIQFGFWEQFIGKELSFSIANFGYVLTTMTIFGMMCMYFKAAKGNELYLVFIVFYSLFFIPFSMMSINYELPHDLFLYWNRYYFSEIFLIHIFSILVAFNVIYTIIKKYVVNKGYLNSLFILILLAILTFTFNSKLFSLTTENGYLTKSSELFQWVGEKTKNSKLLVLYDPKIKYGPYNAKQLMEIGFSKLRNKSAFYQQSTTAGLDDKKFIEKHQNIENTLLLCLSTKPCSYKSENIELIDKLHFSVEGLQHRPKLNKPKFAQIGFEASLYRLIPRLMLNTQYDVNFQSLVILNVLKSGWHKIESDLVWSKPKAVLRIPMRDECSSGNCLLQLKFNVFNASIAKPKDVLFVIDQLDPVKIRVNRGGLVSQTINVPPGGDELTIHIPNAVSPYDLGVSRDNRKLGIALRSLKLEVKENKK